MISKDMASLQDVYEELRAPKASKASYHCSFFGVTSLVTLISLDHTTAATREWKANL